MKLNSTDKKEILTVVLFYYGICFILYVTKCISSSDTMNMLLVFSIIYLPIRLFLSIYKNKRK